MKIDLMDIALGASVLCLFGVFAVEASNRINCPRVAVTVKEVGGCNRDGRCGVLYSDGSSGDERFPVVGQTVVICKAGK